MTVPGLVLDLFPGIGLLARAFEQEGFCVVSGPDLIFGGDVRSFDPPAGVFEGVIGGPPCQAFSQLANIVRAKGLQTKPNLIPEYERIVRQAQPAWFVMENVPAAPEPMIDGYVVCSQLVNNRWLGESQNRVRRFSFGTHDGRCLDLSPSLVALETPEFERTVVAASGKNGALAKSQKELRDRVHERLGERASVLPGSHPRRPLAKVLELQGLPPDFLEGAPFTVSGKYMVIGNGVPLPMGRAIAAAVRRAMAERAVAA